MWLKFFGSLEFPTFDMSVLGRSEVSIHLLSNPDPVLGVDHSRREALNAAFEILQGNGVICDQGIAYQDFAVFEPNGRIVFCRVP